MQGSFRVVKVDHVLSHLDRVGGDAGQVVGEAAVQPNPFGMTHLRHAPLHDVMPKL